MKADGDQWFKLFFECKSQGEHQLHDPLVLRGGHRVQTLYVIARGLVFGWGKGLTQGHLGN